MTVTDSTHNWLAPPAELPPIPPATWDSITGKPSSFPPAYPDMTGNDGKALMVNGGAATWGTVATSSLTTITHSWVIPGDVVVPSGDANVVPPMIIKIPAGKTAKLISASYKIGAGTSATVKIQKNGVDATGFTGMSATTTLNTTNPADITLADDDLLQPIVTAVSGSPKNMSMSVTIEYGG
jgi:hypothetical protein